MSTKIFSEVILGKRNKQNIKDSEVIISRGLSASKSQIKKAEKMATAVQDLANSKGLVNASLAVQNT